MILEKITSNFLKELTIRYLKKRYWENPIQRVLVDYLLGKEKIYSDEGSTTYLGSIRLNVNKNAKEEIELDREKILKKLENEKHFLIDLSLYHIHTEKGKKSLKVQISQSLKEMRDFLFDQNLVLIGDLDFSFLGKTLVKVYKSREDFPFENYKALILDPYAEDILTEQDLKKYDLFLIGGIVDVGYRWEGATQYLFRELDLDRKKIVLGDSIRGVPDRINLIIRILLMSYYMKLPLKTSILLNQHKKDILERIGYEVRKYRVKDYITKENVIQMLEFLNLELEDLEKLLKEMNIKVK